jgi:hypothetical protein
MEAHMRILVLDGNPEPAAGGLDRYLGELEVELARGGHEVTRLRLRELDMHNCVGCFGCWVRTPGECAFDDEGRAMDRAIIGADLCLYASPLLMGHVSALLRRANERCLPLLQPYLRLVDSEIRHVPRYPRRPRLGLLVEPAPGDDAEDVAVVERSYQMTARNFATTLAFTLTTGAPVTEVAHALAAA